MEDRVVELSSIVVFQAKRIVVWSFLGGSTSTKIGRIENPSIGQRSKSFSISISTIGFGSVVAISSLNGKPELVSSLVTLIKVK